MLLAVIFLLAILMLSLSVAVPKITQDLRRDREVETMQRGKQYKRAIQLYYRKFHTYPPNQDALVNTDGIRFLRKRYIDPITGKDDWQPIAFGQNKVPMAMGFFGQAMVATAITGIGPGGAGQNGVALDPMGSSAPVVDSPTGQAPNGVTDPGAASTVDPGTQGAGSTATPTFGGAGVIGFKIPSEKQSLLIYKRQGHYNQWEFTYSPLQDQMNAALTQPGGTGAGVNGIGTTSTPVGMPVGDPAPVNGGSSQQWSPNGNLPVPPSGPGDGNGTTNPWSPNGNLPSAPPQH